MILNRQAMQEPKELVMTTFPGEIEKVILFGSRAKGTAQEDSDYDWKKDQFSTSKHKQLLGWFNRTYVRAGRFDKRYSRFIREAYENRIKSDYDVRSNFSREQVEQAFAEMQEVIAAIEKLL